MSLYDRVALVEAADEVGVYKGKKYRVTGYRHGGKVVELAFFSDPTKNFKVGAGKVKIQKSSPKRWSGKKVGAHSSLAAKKAKEQKAFEKLPAWLKKERDLGFGVRIDHKRKAIDLKKLHDFDDYDQPDLAAEAFQSVQDYIADLERAGYRTINTPRRWSRR